MMRYILCIGIFFVCLSSDLVVAESTKKYKKFDIDEDSREKLPKNNRDDRKNIHINDKFEQKEKCKAKQCISGNPVTTAKFRSDKFESSGDKIVNRKQQKPYKSKNINLENDEKYLTKVKKRLEINQDDSDENLENQSKLKKRDKNTNNREENKQRRLISKTDDNDEDSEEREPRFYKMNKKQRHYNNNNDNSEMTVQKKVKNVKFKNKNMDDDDEIDKFRKFKPKIKKKIDKKIDTNNDVTVENDNSDDDSADISDAISDVLEDKDESHDDEDNYDENNSDNDNDDDSSTGKDDNDQDEDTESQPSCNKKPDCKDCNCDDDSDEEASNEVAVPKKKVKYSIKFAHEKQKYTPSDSSNMLRKIHGLEKKKNMLNHDSDEDSSEEDVHPKRLHFGDDEEDY